jgi:hypothetical protein
MVILHPASEPPGFSVQSSYSMTNLAPSTGRALFSTALLFKFTYFFEQVTIRIDLLDDQQPGVWLASDTIHASAADTEKFVQFQGFPPRPTGSPMDSCNYAITLINETNPVEGTSVQVAVLRM